MKPDSSRFKAWQAAIAILIAVISLGGPPAFGQDGRKCLWAVSSGQNTVYLLGSIHLLSRYDYPLDEAFEDAYRDSAVVVFETDLDEMDRPETQSLMMQHSLLPKGRFIRDVLSAQTFQMLKAYLQAQGLDMVRFEGLRPWVCALTLTMLELSKRGYLPAYGIDHYFYQNARRDRKKIVPLESVEEQLSLFFELGNAEQDAFLRRTLTDLEIVETLFPEMLVLWKSGDLKQLDRIMQDSFAGHPALYDKFLVRRNAKWLPVIEGLIGQPDNVLVIVGASHLGGEKGVIRQLQNKGYKVVQK
ncbi:MAG: TraB/GumN family protein [Desulfobacterales bacterium]|nr:TraB/GumN family protein [Desulfobacterales bacterium]